MRDSPQIQYPLNGQWLGRFTGSNQGVLVVDLEAVDGRYDGYAYIWDENPQMPGLSAMISMDAHVTEQTIRVVLTPTDPRTGFATTAEILMQAVPSLNVPTTATVTFWLRENVLHVRAQSNIDTFLEAELPRTRAAEPSEYDVQRVDDWEGFVDYIATLERRRFIFRGQDKPHRLRTAFHRTGRSNLTRFLNVDRDTLHRHLSSRTKHLLNPWFPEQNGALISLAQHHGYPTPLLDWTYSPYIAAFFAYRKYTNAEAAVDLGKIRIFVFDLREWCEDFFQYTILNPIRPHISVMHFLAIDNERLIPQQSVSLVTNLDDLESYIRLCEGFNHKTYLRVIDLPVNLRQPIMSHLSVMGITAGSMLPGFDGICEELRERFFP